MGVCLTVASVSVQGALALDVNGVIADPVPMLVANTAITDMSQCPGVVALTYQEYKYPNLVLPPSEDMASAFQAGFILPMAGFVLAYCVGRVVAMFNPDHG